MNNGVQLDGAKNIAISPDGSLFRDGITKITPQVEDDTGYRYFEVSSNTDPGEKEKRYVHVEVFRHHSRYSDLPDLDPEDVAFKDEDRANPGIKNLQLSDRGLAKYNGEDVADVSSQTSNGKGETGDGEEADVNGETSNVESQPADDEDETGDENTVETQSQPGDDEDETDEDEETGTGSRETGNVNSETSNDETEDVNSESEEDSEEPDQKVFRAVKPNPDSTWYDLIDPDTDKSVLEAFNGGSNINGQKNVKAIAEEHGIEVVFDD